MRGDNSPAAALPWARVVTAVIVRGLRWGRFHGLQGRRLAFEGGGDADVANALRVAQSACAGAEAEIGEVRAAEELRSDVAGERRSHWLVIEGVAQSLRCRIPGPDLGHFSALTPAAGC